MKLYIAQATCSLAAQLVANELGLSPELVHFDVHNRTTSNGQSFTEVNPLAYVPVLELDNDASDRLTETIVVTSYLADQHPEAGLKAYTELDRRLADGRKYITGDKFTVADAYVWATMWHERSGAKIDHLKNLMDYVARVDARPSARKALKDEAEMVNLHQSRVAA